jgi:integrase
MSKDRGAEGRRPYKYLIETPDRHGNVRLYYRPPGGSWVRLREKPGTAAFDAEYGRAMRNETAPRPADCSRRLARQGSLRWLVEAYYVAAPFQRLDESTRRVRRRILDGICQIAGDYPYGQMEPKDVAKLRDAKLSNSNGATPEAANARVKALRAVFAWATMPEYAQASRNPAAAVSYLPSNNPDGHRTWTETEAQQYETRHPLGTKARLAFDLLVYTGVRISDLALLGPQMERDGRLVFTEQKGRKHHAKPHQPPILPALRRSIEAYRANNPEAAGHLVYLVTEQGRPHTVKGLGNWFARQCRMAGLNSGLSAHGIRKFGAVRALEEGASAAELQALFGWSTMKQVELYTRKANRARLEDSAAAHLERENKTGIKADETVALLGDVASGATIRAKKA